MEMDSPPNTPPPLPPNIWKFPYVSFCFLDAVASLALAHDCQSVRVNSQDLRKSENTENIRKIENIDKLRKLRKLRKSKKLSKLRKLGKLSKLKKLRKWKKLKKF